jgi:AcrR family transcriptional regulator
MRTLDPKKHENQRHKIIERSRSLFAKHGFAETSMSAIGRACHLTKPALYHYFKSKEAILSGIFEASWKAAEAQINKLPKASNLSELLLVTGAVYLEYMDDPRNLELCKISLKEGDHNSVVHAKSISFVQPRMDRHILGLFAPYFKKGASQGSIRVFACQFFGALFYYTFVDKMMGETKRLPASREHYLQSLVQIFSHAAK